MSTPTLDSVTPTDLSTLVPALQREVAVPGTFTTVFPNTQTSDLAGLLADSFAQAQLDGFFSTQTVDLTNPAAPVVSPGLSSGGCALVLLYAGESMIRSQIRVLKTKTAYGGGPGITYDVEQSANALTQELKDIAARRTQLLELILRMARAGRAVYVTDGYLYRSAGYLFAYGLAGEMGLGFYGFELPTLGYGF